MKKKSAKIGVTNPPAVAAGNGAAIESGTAQPTSTLFNPIKVSTQAELDAAISAKEQYLEVRGTWDKVVIPAGAEISRVYIYGTAKVGSVYIYGTAKVGSVDIYGTVTGSVYIYGTVTGSVDIYGTAKVGSVYIYGTVTGSVYIDGTVTGSVDIYGTVTGSVYIDGTVTGSVYIYGTAKVGSVDIYGTVTGSVYIYGTAKVGSVYIYGTVTGSVYIDGTVTGSVYIYGTVTGSVYIDGTVTGSVYIYGTAKVGSVYIYGTVTGSVDIYGTVTGSVYIDGTVTETNPAKKYFGTSLEAIQADHTLVLAAAFPPEIAFLRAALVAGKINGHLYNGECACLVGTLEKAGGREVIAHDGHRLAEKWYMGISVGHTPENSTHAKYAVEWIDAFLAAQPARADVAPTS